jgi:hypothetical protein
MAIIRTDHLEGRALKIALKIIETATINGNYPDNGGCRTFYTPEEWADRGEEYGCSSLLIVVHDGGDFAPYFNYAYEAYGSMEKMVEALGPLGVYAEQCTGWYTSIHTV